VNKNYIYVTFILFFIQFYFYFYIYLQRFFVALVSVRLTLMTTYQLATRRNFN